MAMSEGGEEVESIVVVGGAGFIGSHVADALTYAGHDVRLFDRMESPWRRPEQDEVVGDLRNLDQVLQAIDGATVVYNFAALADLNEARDRPLETVEVNVLGNVNVLEASRRVGVKRFLYASTVYVSGREGGFYRCSKQAAEQYVIEYQRTYGLPYTILRFGSLYGPRAPESNGLRVIVTEALRTGRVRYVGHPETVREYIHVEDAARASVAALGEEFLGRRVVLTGHEPIRMADLLETVAEVLGMGEGAVEFLDGEQLGHYTRTPYAADNDLGLKYTPTLSVDLGQGLLQVIEALRHDG